MEDAVLGRSNTRLRGAARAVLRHFGLLGPARRLIGPLLFGKADAELAFWHSIASNYGSSFFEEGGPQHTFRKYCFYFGCDAGTFEGKCLVDVGCGPLGSLHCFRARRKIGVDPLLGDYMRLFPIANHEVEYVASPVEQMPLEDATADVVLCVNALDHVDNPRRALQEIRRILKPGGVLLMELNIGEQPTKAEPHPMTDVTVRDLLEGLFHYEVIKRIAAQSDQYTAGVGAGTLGLVLEVEDPYPYERMVIRAQALRSS